MSELIEGGARDCSLEYLRRALDCGHPVSEIFTIYSQLDSENIISGFVLCQEHKRSSNDLRLLTLEALSKLDEDTIEENFQEILDAQSSLKEVVRTATKKCLLKLGDQNLVDNLPYLFRALKSEYFLTRFLAEELIDSIKTELLVQGWNTVKSHYELAKLGDNPDWLRTSRKTLFRIIKEWSISRTSLWSIYENREFLKICSSSINPEIKESGSKCLMILINKAYQIGLSFSQHKEYWDLLFECSKSENEEIKDYADEIILSVIEDWEITKQENYLDYLTNLQKTANRANLKKSRLIALKILETWPRERFFEKRNFLIRCQESKYFNIRLRSGRLINNISLFEWSGDVEGLLNWHLSGNVHVKKIVSKILNNLPGEYFHGKTIILFLEAQRSIDFNHRQLAIDLANKVKIFDLNAIQQELRLYRWSEQVYVASLTDKLLRKI